MFSSTAYEAFYEIIGLHLHEALINIITSQEVLIGILALTFGAAFFFAAWGFAKKYLPQGMTGKRSRAGIGIFFKLIFSFLLGVSILKVSTHTNVNNYKRVSWHENDYIEKKVPTIQQEYKVSFIFDILTRSSEELAKLASTIVDKLFERTNSELHAPSAFYKAILYSGSASIEDPKLRALLDLYSTQCFDKVIPLLQRAKVEDKISEFFKLNGAVDKALKGIEFETSKGKTVTCLEVKEKVNDSLALFAIKKDKSLYRYKGVLHPRYYREKSNLNVSNALNNYFSEKSESSWLNVQKGAEVQGGWASFLIGWKRFWSHDGFLSLIGLEDLEGANLTAERALQFNQYLKRAPHIKGMVKLFLIAIFPLLIFFIFAGKWKIIISWWAVYFSVLMWTPIWVLLHHLMTSIALSAEVMESFGRLNDGVSLYSSRLITNRLYQFYAIYSWLQVIVGPLPTVLLAWGMFTGFLKDSEEEGAPEGISQTVSVAGSTAGGVATGGVSTGVAAGAKSAASSAGYRESKAKQQKGSKK